MWGCRTVKDYILSLEDNFKIQQMRKEQGLKADSPSMHMIFTGTRARVKPPMARIVSVFKGHWGAAGRPAGGGHPGGFGGPVCGPHRAPDPKGHAGRPGRRAVHRRGLRPVPGQGRQLRPGGHRHPWSRAWRTTGTSSSSSWPGTPGRWRSFLNANSGLRSRFPNVIEFPDYTAQELLDITKSIVKGKGYRLDPGCDQVLLRYYQDRIDHGDPRWTATAAWPGTRRRRR